MASDRVVGAAIEERVAVFLIMLLIAPIVIAYFCDRLGFRIAPLAILFMGVASATAAGRGVRSRLSEITPSGLENRDLTPALTTAVFAGLVLTTFAWLLWLARPHFLPLAGDHASRSRGPDRRLGR